MTKVPDQWIKVTLADKLVPQLKKSNNPSAGTWYPTPKTLYLDPDLDGVGTVGRLLLRVIMDHKWSSSSTYDVSMRARSLPRLVFGNDKKRQHEGIHRALIELKDAKLIDFIFLDIDRIEKNHQFIIDDEDEDKHAREKALAKPSASSSSSLGSVQKVLAQKDLSAWPPETYKAPQPTETFQVPGAPDCPYAKIVELWNNSVVRQDMKVITLHASPTRLRALTSLWAQHPDISFWEEWTNAYQQSFWRKDKEQEKNPKITRFWGFIENPDRIYDLISGRYKYTNKANNFGIKEFTFGGSDD